MSQNVVSFHYTLKDDEGSVLESSIGAEPLSYLEGSGQIIVGLEKALVGLNKGDKKSVFVPAAEAYGEFDEELVARVPRSQLPKQDIEIGDQFHADSPDGYTTVVEVIELTEQDVVLDANHPLAGEDLTFDVEIVDVRAATSEELEHGHSHGPGGHQH